MSIDQIVLPLGLDAATALTGARRVATFVSVLVGLADAGGTGPLAGAHPRRHPAPR